MTKHICIGFLLCLNFVMFSATDTIKLLSVENVNNGVGQSTGCVRITWERCSSDVNPASYTVLRRLESESSWRKIAVVSSSESRPQYIDSVWTCYSYIYYRIRSTNGSCETSDSIQQLIQNEEPATTVQINAVSIEPESNLIRLSWTPCPSPDAYGYRICEGNGIRDIDTVYGAESNHYIVQQAADTGLLFRILAFDSCRWGLLSDVKKAFSCNVKYHPCEKNIEVSWSDPRNSMANIAFYDIMLSKNGGAYSSVARVDDPSLRTATFAVSDNRSGYKVYVRASNADTTITANCISDSVFVSFAPPPDVMYIETLNVLGDNETVEMHCLVDTQKIWQNLFIYISNTLVETVSYTEYIQNNRFLLPYKQEYYHFKISDTCGVIFNETSNVAKPIYLEAEMSGNTALLTVSEYEGWAETDIPYRIFQIKNGDTNLLSTFFPKRENKPFPVFVENLEQIVYLAFFVEAYEEHANPYGVKAFARSNKVELIAKTDIVVHFATGFNPNGAGKIYRPFYIAFPTDDIEFSIFNKFGQMVFSTKRLYDGWDGTFKGKPQPSGAYIYLFVVKRGSITTQKKGTFTIIR